MIYILFSIILLLIGYAWYQSHLLQRSKVKGHDDVQWTINFYTKWYQEKEQEWKEERQQLLDRIQAPTFAEYKTQEVKVIKAQNGEKEPPKLEQL